MSSSGYQLWTVTAGEVPTTSKWNMLGGNDASFNTGNGFNDQILMTRHFAATQIPSSALNLTVNVDNNGWTVYDYGTFKEGVYTRQETGLSFALGAAGGNSYTPTAILLPVGVASIGALKNWSQGFMSNERIFFCVQRSATTDAFFAPNITSVYSATVNLTYYRIDIRARW